MPNPPPFHGLKSAVRASTICADATASRSAVGPTIANRRSMVVVSHLSVDDDHLVSVGHALVIRGAALCIRNVAHPHRAAASGKGYDNRTRRRGDHLVRDGAT